LTLTAISTAVFSIQQSFLVIPVYAKLFTEFAVGSMTVEYFEAFLFATFVIGVGATLGWFLRALPLILISTPFTIYGMYHFLNPMRDLGVLFTLLIVVTCATFLLSIWVSFVIANRIYVLEKLGSTTGSIADSKPWKSIFRDRGRS
jgi:hypothetical protein